MITLITGTPGAGKTLYAVTKLLEELKKKPERPVYTDIVGLQIDGVELPPDDWRQADKGALIIYDEVQFRLAYQRARGKTKYDYILQLTTHRHDGYDIWLITQSAKFLHLDVLELVGRHLHLDRPYGAGLANVFEWESSTPNVKSRTAKDSVRSKTLFKYNKKIFDYYSSVDVDDKTANHKKFKIPFSQYKWLLVGFIVIGWALYNLSSVFADDKPAFVEPTRLPVPQPQPQPEPDPQPQPEPDPQPQPEPELEPDPVSSTKIFDPRTISYIDINLAPTSVASYRNICRLYNRYGQLLINYDDSDCHDYLSNPSLLASPKS